MTVTSDRLAGTARQHARRRGIGRAALAVGAAAALTLGGAIPASAAPVDADNREAAAEEIAELLGIELPTDDANLRDVDIVIENLPAASEAGAPLALELSVSNAEYEEGLGMQDPTGTVALVAPVASPQPGFELLGTEELDENGSAAIVVRPFGLGEQEVIPVYLGDEYHFPTFSFGNTFEVLPVSAAVNLEFDVDDDGPIAYTGGTLTTYATVSSECTAAALADDDYALVELCRSTYGDPHGTVTLTMNDEVVGEQQVSGSQALGLPTWLDLDTDLTAPEADFEPLAVFEVEIPDALLGSPDAYDFEATFTPENWFTGAAAGPYTVPTSAATTTTEIVIGDLENPVTEVQAGEEIAVQAYVAVEPYWAAPAAGTLNFYLDDELLVEGVEFEEAGWPIAEIDVTFPAEEVGEHTLSAEFVPNTLNHTGSVSGLAVLTVTKAPAPGPQPAPTPDHDGKGTAGGSGSDSGSTGAKGNLAQTGAENTALFAGLGGLLVAGAAASLLLAQRRRSAGTDA